MDYILTSNGELYHYKYISRKKVNGQWVYEYPDDTKNSTSYVDTALKDVVNSAKNQPTTTKSTGSTNASSETTKNDTGNKSNSSSDSNDSSSSAEAVTGGRSRGSMSAGAKGKSAGGTRGNHNTSTTSDSKFTEKVESVASTVEAAAQASDAAKASTKPTLSKTPSKATSEGSIPTSMNSVRMDSISKDTLRKGMLTVHKYLK